jgi:aspartyl-tRNA(Asn)/glutamyl-tRNA(Gln) amidotransferase subunit B
MTGADAHIEYEPVIGLEVHAQLATASKMFCACPTTFGGEPNHHCCPICVGHPGTLPRVNAEAVRLAVRLGLALGCHVHPHSVFARKNYFYPDLPKGYQISQFDKPLCTGGGVVVDGPEGPRTIRLRRIHLEEDAGKSSHGEGGASLVDLNRAGVPLCEIVSEADIRSPDEAMAYMKALRSALRYLGVSDGDMEKGSFRCDANISVRPRGHSVLGTRTELKNINSFRYVGQALHFEIDRQVTLLREGKAVRQETRLWDTKAGRTVFMRSKEEADDYRYFPEPDLPPLDLAASLIDECRAELPDLAWTRAARYQQEFALPAYDAGVLTADRALAEYFEEAASYVGGVKERVKSISNWIMGEVLRRANEEGAALPAIPVRPLRLVQLCQLVDGRTINLPVARQVFDLLWKGDEREPAVIVDALGLRQVSDTTAVDRVIDEVISANPAELAGYRGGKTKLLGFFVGQVMKAMRGQGNPAVINERLKARLDDG